MQSDSWAWPVHHHPDVSHVKSLNLHIFKIVFSSSYVTDCELWHYSLFVFLLSALSVLTLRSHIQAWISAVFWTDKSSDKSGSYLWQVFSEASWGVMVSLCLRLGSGCVFVMLQCWCKWDLGLRNVSEEWLELWCYDGLTADIFVSWLLQVRIKIGLNIPASVVDGGQSWCDVSEDWVFVLCVFIISNYPLY